MIFSASGGHSEDSAREREQLEVEQPMPAVVEQSDEESTPEEYSELGSKRVPRPPREAGEPPSLEAWETVVDRIIRDAMERGEFDNLPGAGKPLNLDENPFAGDSELGFHLLKQNGFTLPWISLGREIEEDRLALRAMLDRSARALAALRDAARTATDRRLYETERQRHREQYLRGASELDRKLGEYSAEAPAWWMDRGRLPPHVASRQFDAACPPM